MTQALDSRHWSQRWLRIARIDDDAVVIYDLHAGIEIEGCGRGSCRTLKFPPVHSGRRYRVTRFWNMELCPHCGRTFGFAQADKTLYLGESLTEAEEAFEAAEFALHDY